MSGKHILEERYMMSRVIETHVKGVELAKTMKILPCSVAQKLLVEPCNDRTPLTPITHFAEALEIVAVKENAIYG